MDPAAKPEEQDEESAALRSLLGAPEDQLRRVLLELCRDPAVRKTALQHYAAAQSGGAQLKRKASNDLSVCVFCKGPFTEAENVYGSCIYHPGNLEFDDDHDVWQEAEWWEGDLDTEEWRRDLPEGFKWNCCHQDGTNPGCVKGWHETKSQRENSRTINKAKIEYLLMDDND